jgi:hypothetical protein
MKYIKLYENRNNELDIEKYLADNYFGDEYIFKKSDEPLGKSIHVGSVRYKDYEIRFRDYYNIVVYSYDTYQEPVEFKDDLVNKPPSKFSPLNSWEKVYDFHNDENFHHLFYGEDFTEKEFKEFKKLLRYNKGEDYLLLYHGTACEIPIKDEGLKRTKKSTKKSLQSQPGYVYLSVFPNMAKKFGELAYPGKDICVYQVFIKIKYLKPDMDQLYNKRMWGDGKYDNLGKDLATSLIYGHGARANRDILPYELQKYNVD